MILGSQSKIINYKHQVYIFNLTGGVKAKFMGNSFEGDFSTKKETPWDKFPHGTLVKSEFNGEIGVVLPHPNGDDGLMCNTFWVMYRKDSKPMIQQDVDEVVINPHNYDHEKFQGYLTNPSNCEYVGEVHVLNMEVVERDKNIELKPTGTDGLK